MRSAFLQTRTVERDVYVHPPRESQDRRRYWLLLSATYSLVNANAKFQHQFDGLMVDIGWASLLYISQHFYRLRENKLVLLVAKIVDDSLITGEAHVMSSLITGEASIVSSFVKTFDKKFKPGTVVSGPGVLDFYGVVIELNDDNSVIIHAGDKLLTLDCLFLAVSLVKASAKVCTHQS